MHNISIQSNKLLIRGRDHRLIAGQLSLSDMRFVSMTLVFSCIILSILLLPVSLVRSELTFISFSIRKTVLQQHTHLAILEDQIHKHNSAQNIAASFTTSLCNAGVIFLHNLRLTKFSHDAKERPIMHPTQSLSYHTICQHV